MDTLQAFHKTRAGYLTFGFVELVLVYIFASISLDTANMFAYALTIVLLVGVCVNVTGFIRVTRKKSKIGK